MLIDIDDFKTFNDRLGHTAGDAIIRSIAQEIMATVRASDTVFRFGGDEFVVISEDVTGEAALALGERVRREIATRVESAGSRVTVSVGVATTAGGVVDYDLLFQLADRCLYQAKAAGRNCTIGDRVASSEAPVRLVYSG